MSASTPAGLRLTFSRDLHGCPAREMADRPFDAFRDGRARGPRPQTIVDRSAARASRADHPRAGWTISDQELEIGLRSVAAPITGPDGRTVAAMNVFGATSRISPTSCVDEFLPALLETAAAGLAAELRRWRALTARAKARLCSAVRTRVRTRRQSPDRGGLTSLSCPRRHQALRLPPPSLHRHPGRSTRSTGPR